MSYESSHGSASVEHLSYHPQAMPGAVLIDFSSFVFPLGTPKRVDGVTRHLPHVAQMICMTYFLLHDLDLPAREDTFLIYM